MTFDAAGTSVPEGAKWPSPFFRKAMIVAILMLLVTVGVSVAMLIIIITQGGAPSTQEMCDDMPGMCGPLPTGMFPPGGMPTGPPGNIPTGPPGGIPTGPPALPTTGAPNLPLTETPAATAPPPTQGPGSGHTPTYQIKDSPAYTQVALQFLTSVNFTVDPCEDFYAYACGQWPAQHPQPASSGAWSEYSLVSAHVSDAVKTAVEKANLSVASEGVAKAKHFYDQCMNVGYIEHVRGTLLGKWLHTGRPEDASLNSFEDGTGKWALIDSTYAASTKVTLEQQIARLKSKFGIDTYFLAYAMQYSQNAGETILWLTPTMLPLGMGMFQQPYYTNPKYKYVMNAYQQLQKEVAQLLARDSAFGNVQLSQADLDGMLNLEIAVANLTSTYSFDIEIQKPTAAAVQSARRKRSTFANWNNDLWDVGTLQQKLPGFNWVLFLQDLVSPELWQKLANGEKLLWIDAPDYYHSLIELLSKTTARDIRNYGIWRLIKYSLPYLSKEYTTALSKFNSVVANKTVTPKAQADVCLSYIRGNYEMPNLGFATAEAMVRAGFFPSQSKTAAVAMVGQVKQGLLQLIQGNTWMDATTKQNALQKAKLMDSSIAYPEWVLNNTAQAEYYKNLKIPPKASFISLNLMLRAWAVGKQLSSVGVPFDRSAFPGTPVATDAWYTQSTNSLTVPLGELQTPFFGLAYPDAVNYGAAGAVFGHEMSHGFDKNGAQYNAYGNQSNWWSASSKQAFNDRCNCLVDQFSHYCYDGIGCVNGNNTIDENVADLAGLKAAYRAFKAQPGPQYRLAKAPMFSNDQLFFLSFASFWCGSESSGALQQQLQTDVHSPLRYRVIGTVRNMPEFANAFQCSATSYMNPSKRCAIW